MKFSSINIAISTINNMISASRKAVIVNNIIAITIANVLTFTKNITAFSAIDNTSINNTVINSIRIAAIDNMIVKIANTANAVIKNTDISRNNIKVANNVIKTTIIKIDA